MIQNVLAIAGPVFKSSKKFNKLMMHVVNSKLYNNSLAFFSNVSFNVFPGFFNHFFNFCRVNSSVSYQSFKRKLCNFASDRLKRRKSDSLRCIVDYKVNAGQAFNRSYVSSFSSYYSSFHVIARKRND